MLSQSAAALAAGARSYAALGVDDHVRRPNLCCSRHCRPVPEPLHDVRQGIEASHELGKHQECRLEIGEIKERKEKAQRKPHLASAPSFCSVSRRGFHLVLRFPTVSSDPAAIFWTMRAKDRVKKISLVSACCDCSDTTMRVTIPILILSKTGLLSVSPLIRIAVLTTLVFGDGGRTTSTFGRWRPSLMNVFSHSENTEIQAHLISPNYMICNNIWYFITTMNYSETSNPRKDRT